VRRTQEFLKLSALRRTVPSKRTLWYTLAPLKRFGLSTSLLFVLRNPRFDYSPNQCGFQRLVYGEADGPFRCGVAFKFILERFDRRGFREQAAVVRKRGEPKQDSFVLEGGNPVTDGLGGLRWENGPNRGANLVQSAAGRFRDTSQIFVNTFRSGAGFRHRPASGGPRSFHADNATSTSTSNPERAVPGCRRLPAQVGVTC